MSFNPMARPADGASFVTIDGIDFPLVPGSEVLAAPLNPFSPSVAAGNSGRIVSQRHAVRVWDDFTQGVGHRDDNEEHGGYAYGNLDARQPGQLAPPPRAGNIAQGGGGLGQHPYVRADAPIKCFFQSWSDGGTYSFITAIHQTATTGSKIRRCTSNPPDTTGLTNATSIPDGEYFRGHAEWNGFWYIMTETSGGAYKLWRSTAGTAASSTWTNVATAAATQMYGLTNYDGKLITYNATLNTFQQYDGAAAFAAYIGGFVAKPGGEEVRELFVWTDRSGSRDALYALTSNRILVYDEEGEQWETFYDFSLLFIAPWPTAHVNRRDNTLVVTFPTNPAADTQVPTGNILAFSPGTVDSIPIDGEYAYPAALDYGGPFLASSVSYITQFASGVHWLFAFCYAKGSTDDGLAGGVFARNEFGGWTQVVDHEVLQSGKSVIGGCYGGNYLFHLSADDTLNNGRFYVTYVPDQNINHPFNTYDASGEYFIQSGRVYNQQRHVVKLASHFEVKFKDTPSGASDVRLKWRTWNGAAVSAFTTSANLYTGNALATVDIGLVTPYRYLEWQLTMTWTGTGTLPVVESIALYYTYWQENHFAYSCTIDLSEESWAAKNYRGAMFHGKSREALQASLLALIDGQVYHTFEYNRYNQREAIAKADVLLSRREWADNGGGIYPITVRDMEP